MSDFPSSKFERTGIIAKTGLKVGANYASYHLKKVLGADHGTKGELHTRNATEVFKEFSRLRGTALKLAQTMSLDTSILPDEFVDIMAQSQYQVPPINRVLVRTIIKRELGKYPEELFRSFTPDAIAAASIGQVHRAVLHDGRAVAVKIQYPNVRDTIDSDLSIARTLFKRIAGTRSIDDYFNEVREKLLEETDYENEGRQLTAYRERFNTEKFATPEWLPEYSTKRVLTMTFLEGRHLDALLAENPPQETLDHYGQLMWDFFHAQIDNSYTVYADAHPGNFIFTHDGRLGIIDFGCIKTSPADFFDNYIRLFDVHMRDDDQLMRQVYQNLEMVDEHPSDVAFNERFYAFCRNFGGHFLSPYNTEVFDFGNPEFGQKIAVYAKEATSFTEPRGSRHFIFVSRLHVGLYRMLMKLSARVYTTEARMQLEAYNEQRWGIPAEGDLSVTV
jgi:predicted unusual protein kinase regulating ubiquinone biosynthesis (AarF/ABC1/UbiB family)